MTKADPMIPTMAQKAAQGAKCGCQGLDDYCPCQNVVQGIPEPSSDWVSNLGTLPIGMTSSSGPDVGFRLTFIFPSMADMHAFEDAYLSLTQEARAALKGESQ